MNWVEANLGDCCELYQPQTITTKELKHDGKYLVYGANGVIGKYDKYNHEEPQLLVTCRGATCGAVNISSAYAWINGNAMVVKPKDKDIDIRFLEYFFRGAVDLTKAITGAAQPQITRQSLSPIKFCYPPLAIQNKIVKKLDAIFLELDRVSASSEANSKNSEALFQAFLHQIFETNSDGFKRVRLGDVCSFDKKQGNHKNLPYIGMEHIESNTSKFIGDINNHEVLSSTFRFDETHVLYGRLRPYLNKVLAPDFEGHCSTEIFPLKPSNQLNRDFLKFWLLSDGVNRLINETCTGARMPRANMNLALQFELPLPDINEQDKIVTRLNSIQELSYTSSDCYKKQVKQLLLLKQSILKQAFIGELVEEQK